MDANLGQTLQKISHFMTFPLLRKVYGIVSVQLVVTAFIIALCAGPWQGPMMAIASCLGPCLGGTSPQALAEPIALRIPSHHGPGHAALPQPWLAT